MSNTKKIEISNVDIKEALLEIKNLSNNQAGVIYNKNAQESIAKILSGDNIEIDNVASSNENNKIVNKKEEPKVTNKNKNTKTSTITPKLK